MALSSNLKLHRLCLDGLTSLQYMRQRLIFPRFNIVIFWAEGGQIPESYRDTAPCHIFDLALNPSISSFLIYFPLLSDLSTLFNASTSFVISACRHLPLVVVVRNLYLVPDMPAVQFCKPRETLHESRITAAIEDLSLFLSQ